MGMQQRSLQLHLQNEPAGSQHREFVPSNSGNVRERNLGLVGEMSTTEGNCEAGETATTISLHPVSFFTPLRCAGNRGRTVKARPPPALRRPPQALPGLKIWGLWGSRDPLNSLGSRAVLDSCSCPLAWFTDSSVGVGVPIRNEG
ncbi:hypothetical protein PG997_013478 [Apiospora hydei]|uniref:Uncharacterized protein n=1 Tax=Apiospora hydei TaxID=1337664 RepID=A0ABR1V6A2_9PEZI